MVLCVELIFAAISFHLVSVYSKLEPQSYKGKDLCIKKKVAKIAIISLLKVYMDKTQKLFARKCFTTKYI